MIEMLLAAVLLAQTPPSILPTDVKLGVLVRLAWDWADAVPPGREVRFRVYVDQVASDPLVGPPEGTMYSLYLPAFITTGPRTLKVSARWAVTDPTLWQCGTPDPDKPTVPPTIGCGEAMSDPLAIAVVAPAVDLFAIAAVPNCNITAVAKPPDTTGGWTAQFRHDDGVQMGLIDQVPPYERTKLLPRGNHTITVTFTKAGQPTHVGTFIVGCGL